MPRAKVVATNKNNIKISINTKSKRSRRRAPAPAPRAPVQNFFQPRQIEYIVAHTNNGIPPVQPKVEPPIQRPVLLPLHTNTGVPQRIGIHPIRTQTQSVGVGSEAQTMSSTGSDAFFNPNENSDARNKELIKAKEPQRLNGAYAGGTKISSATLKSHVRELYPN